MKLVRAFSLALALVVVAAPSWAQQADPHAAHHPGMTTPATGDPTPRDPAAAPARAMRLSPHECTP